MPTCQPDSKLPGMHEASQPASRANLAKRWAAGMTLIPACSSLLSFWISAAFPSDLGTGATTAPSRGRCSLPLPVGNSNPPSGFPSGSIGQTVSSSPGDPASLPSSSIVSGKLVSWTVWFTKLTDGAGELIPCHLPDILTVTFYLREKSKHTI